MTEGTKTTKGGNAAVDESPKNRNARFDYLEDLYLNPQAHEEKISQWEAKELRAERPWLWKGESDETGNPQSTDHSPNIVVPRAIAKQSDLADWLHNYFKEHISLTITSTLIGNWRKGLQVGRVAVDGKVVKPPPFPNKNDSGNRWVTQDCIDWVERWIVPQKAVSSGGQSAAPAGSAADIGRLKEEHEIWKMQRERAIAEGKYKSAELFDQQIISIAEAVNAALNNGEKGLRKKVLESVIVALPNLDESGRAVVSEAVNRISQEVIDALRFEIKKSMEKQEEQASP